MKEEVKMLLSVYLASTIRGDTMNRFVQMILEKGQECDSTTRSIAQYSGVEMA